MLEILHEQTDVSLRQIIESIETEEGPFSSAEREGLFAELSRNRQTQIDNLRFYRERGKFPQNTGHSESAVPIFVDDSGTHCAVGYLMHRSGHDQAVANIVESDNYVYVSDAVEGELFEWIKTSGLTVDESALIQPGYCLLYTSPSPRDRG